MDAGQRRQEWVNVFAALASEHRLQLVELLSYESMPCQVLQNHLKLSQPAVSYHLAKLESAGVLIKEKSGTRNCYHVKKEIADLVRHICEEEREAWITK